MIDVMDEKLLRSLPGAEIVLGGIADLARGVESVDACAVQSASARLARVGITVGGAETDTPAAHRLYRQLAEECGDGAHARYNAMLERVGSFARAAEIARAR